MFLASSRHGPLLSGVWNEFACDTGRPQRRSSAHRAHGAEQLALRPGVEPGIPRKQPIGTGIIVGWVISFMFLFFFVVAAMLARRNILQGRADRRGAMRIAVFFAVLTLAFDALRSHALFTRQGQYSIWLVMGSAIFMGVVVWCWYLALEPYGKRIWPSMFIIVELDSEPATDALA